MSGGLRAGAVVVDCKGKTRTILVPGKLQKLLLAYVKNTGWGQG